jgi:hypothetical protein
MMNTVLRIESPALTELDANLAQLAWVRLVRSDAGLLFECAEREVPRATALLARSGARGIATEHPLPVSSDLVPAIMADLGPVVVPGTIDSLLVRPLDVGEATGVLMLGRRRIALVGRRRRDVSSVRAVLHSEDRLFAWRRVLWARPSLFRSRRVHGARPVVFDRDAVERGTERFALARAGELTRWARG